MTAPVSWLLAVKARLDSTELIAVSNTDAQTQVAVPAIDDTRLQAVIDDAIGVFMIQSGFEPLLTDPSHVATVVFGTKALLLVYKGQGEAGMPLKADFIRDCKRLRDVASTAPGTTNSGQNALTPTEDAPNGRIVRPDSDRANYRRYLPRNRLGAGWWSWE